MLTERQQTILRIIIDEYISTARPIGSEQIVRRYDLGVSPATIRNDMAELDAAGFISQPHTSAGRVPTDRGYRHYISSLLGRANLPDIVRQMVRHQFHQVESDIDEWTRLGAAVLARLVHNAALVRLPRPAATRLKVLQLVPIHDQRALVVALLTEGIFKQQLLTFAEPVGEEELADVVNRLNPTIVGLTAFELRRHLAKQNYNALEHQVATAVLKILEVADRHGREDVWIEGLRNLLSQPEFADADRMRAMLEVLGERSVARTILPDRLPTGEVHVTIGDEHLQQALRDCTVIVAGYGVPGNLEGVLGVVGPTRMPYQTTIATVRYLSEVMSELLVELHG